jgi:hypothetical protein
MSAPWLLTEDYPQNCSLGHFQTASSCPTVPFFSEVVHSVSGRLPGPLHGHCARGAAEAARSDLGREAAVPARAGSQDVCLLLGPLQRRPHLRPSERTRAACLHAQLRLQRIPSGGNFPAIQLTNGCIGLFLHLTFPAQRPYCWLSSSRM